MPSLFNSSRTSLAVFLKERTSFADDTIGIHIETLPNAEALYIALNCFLSTLGFSRRSLIPRIPIAGLLSFDILK